MQNYRVRPRERFLDPLPFPHPINFVHDHLFFIFSKNIIIYFFIILDKDRQGGRALRLGQARGPSPTARTGSGAGRCGLKLV